MDLLVDAICVVDTEGRFVFVSAASVKIFGYTPEEMIGRPMIELVFHEDRERTLNRVDDLVSGAAMPHFENRYVRKDGSLVHIMWSARWSEADQVRVAVARDVTERRRAESMQAALYAISEAAYAAEDLIALFRHIHEVIGQLLPARNFFVALYDAASERLSFPYHVDERQAAPAPCPLDASTLSAELMRGGRALRVMRDGSADEPMQDDVGVGPLDGLGVPLIGHAACIGALVVKSYAGAARYSEQDVELLQFVSRQVAAAIERKQLETRLQHMARHDPLTGLPNRELFDDRFRTALARVRRDNTRLGLLYLDLNRFKQVNDEFGHAVGDLLLQEVALRLKTCVRESDTVGRIGGDEFVLLLNSIQQPDHAALVAAKIDQALALPFAPAGRPLTISSSIGIAIYPEHGTDGAQLLRHADEAMYASKRRLSADQPSTIAAR